MLNRCQFIGNLGRDPEIKTTNSGKKFANLSIGVSEKWKDKNGERQEKTEWIRITIWNEKLAEIAERYLSKGSKIYIEGKMQTRKYQDQSGADRYSTEVILQGFDGNLVMLSPKGEGGAPTTTADRMSAEADKNFAAQGGSLADEIDDEIPF